MLIMHKGMSAMICIHNCPLQLILWIIMLRPRHADISEKERLIQWGL
uniref:Uncharacterized protein n=1 Tax=Rhizophora mucronata TaxID=61149 RepID=A0A2P2P5B9_RHIMU